MLYRVLLNYAFCLFGSDFFFLFFFTLNIKNMFCMLEYLGSKTDSDSHKMTKG